MRARCVLWCFIGLLGCGSKGAVSLTADIGQGSLVVKESPFGSASLTGSFELHLALGPEASGSTSVTLGNFSLQSASGAALVEILHPDVDADFPLVIEKGASKTVIFTLNKGDSVERDQACPGPVRIVGSVMDSLKGGTDPVSSPLITPDCRPAT